MVSLCRVAVRRASEVKRLNGMDHCSLWKASFDGARRDESTSTQWQKAAALWILLTAWRVCACVCTYLCAGVPLCVCVWMQIKAPAGLLCFNRSHLVVFYGRDQTLQRWQNVLHSDKISERTRSSLSSHTDEARGAQISLPWSRFSAPSSGQDMRRGRTRRRRDKTEREGCSTSSTPTLPHTSDTHLRHPPSILGSHLSVCSRGGGLHIYHPPQWCTHLVETKTYILILCMRSWNTIWNKPLNFFPVEKNLHQM